MRQVARIGAMMLGLAAWPTSAAPIGAQRDPTSQTVGVYRGWAAFRDARRCYAIARPVVAAGGWRTPAAASIATWPARGLRSSLHIRLSRLAAPGAVITLTAGERRFQLIGRGHDAWATDSASDRALVAALRLERSMSVEWVGVGGRPFADTYALAGAATAIDAAALACLGLGGR
ncbi:hypothetical protein ASG67_08540 [Sphingomonas sp. Leaf339]|nr:hypothetical protein ASG67_08540 [Sphingomonas sp. Leaf339]